MKDKEATQMLTDIAANTQNDLIIFLIVATAAMMLVLIPVYGMILTDRKERRKAEQARIAANEKAESDRLEQYIRREQHFINVIKENSEVIAGFKVILENNVISTGKSIDQICINIGELTTGFARNQIQTERMLANQTQIFEAVMELLNNRRNEDETKTA